jgi:hypothetical protein
MANKKFSDYTATTTLVAADLFAVETAAGNSRKITRDNVRASMFSGALVHKSADQTGANYSAGAVVAWNSEASGYDTDSYHDIVTNNSRITMPANGKYEFRAGIAVSSLTSADYVRALIIKNGVVAEFVGTGQQTIEIISTPTVWLNLCSAPIDLVATDYLEVWLDTETDTSISVVALGSWFSVRRVA